MAQFLFKVDDKETSLDTLKAGALKDALQELESKIAMHIQSLTCQIHQREPIIILHSTNSKVTLAGFGTCCAEFASQVEKLIADIEGIKDPNVNIVTREMRYTHHAE